MDESHFLLFEQKRKKVDSAVLTENLTEILCEGV